MVISSLSMILAALEVVVISTIVDGTPALMSKLYKITRSGSGEGRGPGHVDAPLATNQIHATPRLRKLQNYF